jgi:hypothetical protein
MRDNGAARTDSNELVCVWVAIQGPDGRVHMEARWHVISGALTQPAA